jgi:excinuclease ABC subunit B
MKNAIQETARRRALQEAYNLEHGITPKTVFKAISEGIGADLKSRKDATDAATSGDATVYITEEYIAELEKEMLAAAEDLDFERAGTLRDRISQMKDSIGKPLSSVETERSGSKKGRKTKRRRRGGAGSKIPRPRKQS